LSDFTNGEFNQNIARVDNLINTYRLLEEQTNDTQSKDILRAAIVFLHSSLEEVVRNLYLARLPSGTVENLNKIPYGGHDFAVRANLVG
jgi:hypothetical protein